MEQVPVRRKKSLSSSIFSMILIINLCSIIILSVFNYYVFHYLSGKARLESFLSHNQRVTELDFKNIDDLIMQSVLKIAQLHFSDIRENEPLRAAQEEDLAQQSQKVQALATEMKKIAKTYPYIANIDIYYEGTQTVVTGFDKVHFPENDMRIHQYIPWYRDYQSGELSEGFCFVLEGNYLQEEPVISYIKKISMPKWGDKNIVLAISVNPESFTQYIDQQQGEFSIFTENGSLLYNSSGQKEDSSKIEAVKEVVLQKKQGDNTGKGYHELHSDQWDMTVFDSLSPVTGLTYVYGLDTASFYEEYSVTSQMLFINFIISIAFNIIVLIVISYYNYRTYRKSVLTLSEQAGITLPQSDKSFEGSLHVLTGKITDLHAAVQSSKGMVQQNAVRSIILNRKPGDGIKELEGYFNGDSVCAYLIEFQKPDAEQPDIERMQEEFLPGNGSYDVLFTSIEKANLVALLIFNRKDGSSIASEFYQWLNEHWQNSAVIAGSTCPLKENGIKISYQSAVDTQRYRYIMTKENRLSYDEIHSMNRKESGSHMKLFETIKKDINNEDLLELKLHLEMLIESFKSGNYTIEYCMSTLRDLVTLFYQIMQQYRLDMWVVLGYDIREYYKKIPDIDAFYLWCDTLCELILKNIHQQKMSVDKDVRTEILRLVDENLEKNISLDFLADRLSIRPDAASRVFRQAMGMGYSEYIKSRKLNRAVELIEQGSSVKDIAEQLGYSTSQYFIKVFKENYGMTPYQYKKNNKKE